MMTKHVEDERVSIDTNEYLVIQAVMHLGELHYRVQLRSVVRPDRLSRGYVPVKHERARHMTQVVAGALAERQNDGLNDIHDPERVADMAGRLWQQVYDRRSVWQD